MGKSILFYNLFPKTTWKEISNKILKNIPHDDVIIHITVPKSRLLLLPLYRIWINNNIPKVKTVLWSFNMRGMGETKGFDIFRKTQNLDDYSILTYAHSKGSSRKRKNTLPVQDWTELMRYYVIERLDLATSCFQEGYSFCGVNLSTNMHPDQEAKLQYPNTTFIYEGNFVSINLDKERGRFIDTEVVKDYYGVERFWGMVNSLQSAFSLHQSQTDHYKKRYPSNMYR